MRLADLLLDAGEGTRPRLAGLHLGRQFFHCRQGGGTVREAAIGDDVERLALQGFLEVAEIAAALLANERLGIGFGAGTEDLQGEVTTRLVAIPLASRTATAGRLGGRSRGRLRRGGGGRLARRRLGRSGGRGRLAGRGAGDRRGRCRGLRRAASAFTGSWLKNTMPTAYCSGRSTEKASLATARRNRSGFWISSPQPSPVLPSALIPPRWVMQVSASIAVCRS